MKQKLVFLMLAFLTLATPVFAQGGGQGTGKITISGKVVDDQGLPVIGAGVMVEGTSTGAATDINGVYTIQAPSNATLSIQSIGYKSVSIPVNGRSKIDVSLAPDTQLLDEIVVVGYGTQKKANLTGAVDVVDSKTFENRVAANVDQMLLGNVPSVGIAITGATAAIHSVWSDNGVPVVKREFFTLDGRRVSRLQSHETYIMQTTDVNGLTRSVKIIKN